MHKNSTKASLFDLSTTTANPCNRALHVAVDSKTSLVVGNLRKAGGKLAMAWLNVLCWWVGTEKRILRSKAVGVSILGNVLWCPRMVPYLYPLHNITVPYYLLQEVFQRVT